ncbi:MAG: beta-lactamase family protein [Tannerellaceae bacterium]|jgi:CubicO group peptidase (beta-lactamase class C family)|nr:beta-lactamase family protein [Tannerellaceae bacterium]
MKLIRRILCLLAALLALAGGYLMLPSNYYLRQTLMHLYPKIDQYPIFENRTVEALSPQPWEKAPAYGALSLEEEDLALFEQYETVAFVVIRNGQLLFESYWEGFSPQSLSNSFSMAKSIVSLAVGCAIDDGFIRSIDQPVSDFFDEFGAFDGETLTLRHLITMSAGMDFVEAYSSPFSPVTKLYYGNDLRALALGMKQIEKPGVYFNYQSCVTQLLAFILEKATGESLSRYVSRKLWTPLHAEENALWSLDKADGMEKAYCCFNTNARDFARFGQLILNKGYWDGVPLVAESYLREALEADTTLTDVRRKNMNRRYGFQFWSLTYDGLRISSMQGLQGQYVFAIPEENAVIVRLGRQLGKPDPNLQYYPADVALWLSAGLKLLRASENR